MCHIIVCAKHSHDSKDTIVATKVKISFTFCALLAIDVKKTIKNSDVSVEFILLAVFY